MALEDNPAGRLHTILTELRGGDQQQPLRDHWSRVLNVPAGDGALLLRAVAAVVGLPDAVERAVRAEPDDGTQELQLRWRGPVDHALNLAHQFEATAATVTQHYDGTALLSLEMAASRIEYSRPSVNMDSDAVAEATRLVGELLGVLTTSEDLDSSVKELLVRHAAALQMALQLAKVTGAEGIRDAMVDAVGALSLATGGSPETDQRPGVKRFVELVGFMASALTIVGVAMQLAPGFSQLIKLIGS